MIPTLLSHAWKRFFRSPSVSKDIATQLTLGVIVLAVLGYSIAAGFALEGIIVKGLKQSHPVSFLNGLLIYYFIAEFVTRYFMQNVPALDAQPYLHLPIARSRMVNFLLKRSMASVMNVFVFLLFTPFALTVVANAYGTAQAWAWLLSLWLVSLANHFVVLLFKKHLDDTVWGLLAFIVVSGILAGSDYLGWFKLSSLSELAFDMTLQGYATPGALFLLVVLLYFLAYRFLAGRLYPDERRVRENQGLRSANWAFLQHFGIIGTWMKIELKLILRHKRTRSVLSVNILVLFYLLILYSQVKNPYAYGYFLFLGTIATGIFVANYGQFLFSWQGKHFDFTLTQPTSVRLFVESKYWLLALFTGLWFLLSIPYLYFGWPILLANVASALFNIGINIFVVMNMAMWSPRSITLARGGTLNYEGMGAAQWVMGIPFIASPYLFYLPFKLLGYPIPGLVAVGMAGLIGIVFRRKLLDITCRRLSAMRYVIASNFRKDQ